MIGKGRYGANATALLEQHGGELCLVVILGGPAGASFDVATTDPDLVALLPAILRDAADHLKAHVGEDVSAMALEHATRGRRHD